MKNYGMVNIYELEDLKPTDEERAAVAGMPEQVAIGHLRAMRKINKNRPEVKIEPLDPSVNWGAIFGGTLD
jgi:hypothetical protein